METISFLLKSSEAVAGIAIPCFNESHRLPAREFEKFFREYPGIVFCFVNDGSNDKTEAILDLLEERWKNQVKYINLKENLGKGEAVRKGIHHLLTLFNLEFVGFWDADLSAPLDEIPEMITVLTENPDAGVICGARNPEKGTRLDRRRLRKFFDAFFSLMVRLFFRFAVRDTQCGAKIFRKNLAKVVFRKSFISRWLFDVEILERANLSQRKGNADSGQLEYPLKTWHEKSHAKITPGYLMTAPIEFLKILKDYKLKKNNPK